MNSTPFAPPIADMVETARRLRTVRKASRHFWAMWALSQPKPANPVALAKEQALADPANHDWSLLYLGSVLDD
jgi:hypothetical protein